MVYPAYILEKEVGESIVSIEAVYFDSEEDAKFVGESLAKINELLFLTGYEVKVVEQTHSLKGSVN